MNPKENESFYDLFLDKSGGVPLFRRSFDEYVNSLGFSVECSLQYDEKDTRSFSSPKVFLLSKCQERLKGRIFNNEGEAIRASENLKYAYEKGISVPKIIFENPPFLILEYVPGDNLLGNKSGLIGKIGELHSSLNIPQGGFEDLGKKFFLLLGQCCDFSGGDRVFKKVKSIFPKVFYPVFDHQDFGIHNLIFSFGKPYLIDEEAFGVLPFGYSLHRAIGGRFGYRVCESEEDKKKYLSNFSDAQRNYYLETENFWDIFLKLRSVKRALVVGNFSLADKLKGELL